MPTDEKKLSANPATVIVIPTKGLEEEMVCDMSRAHD